MKKGFFYKAISSFMALTVAFGSFNAPVYSYAEETFPTAETECANGNILVEVPGTAYYYDSKKLVDAVNAIRKEACDNGYKDPATGQNFKPEDYEKIKIKWSADMEAIAYQRAAEASINKVIGSRPNGKDFKTLATNNKVSSDKEIIYLSSGADAACIEKALEAMKEEKDKWNEKHDKNQSPNYVELINRDNKYIGALAFKANGTTYNGKDDNYKTVVFEFSGKEKLKENSKEIKGSKRVTVELKKDNVSGLVYKDSKDFKLDSTTQLYAYAKVSFKNKNNNDEYAYNHECKITKGSTWSTDNPAVADITSYGSLQAKSIGTANITAKAADQKITFKATVNQSDMSSQIKTKGFKKSLQYDLGNEVKQTGVILYVEINTPDPQKADKTVTAPKELTEGKDYTVEYSNNKEVGTAKVTYKGIGNYSGELVKTFKITPINLKTEKEHNQVSCRTVSDNNIYRKGGCKPKFVVTYKNRILEEGKDYKVQYKNSKKSRATAIIKGKGNYRKSFKFEYSVLPSSLDSVSMNCLDVLYKPNKKLKKYVSKPVLTDVDKKKLKKGVDYDKSIVYTVSGNNGEMVPFSGDVTIEPGLEIFAKVKGIGWYGNSEKTCSYRVVERSIAKAKVKCNTANLTDKLSASDVKVTIKVDGIEEELIPNVDYEIQSAEWNKKKTKLTVTVHGIGKYGLVKKAKVSPW